MDYSDLILRLDCSFRGLQQEEEEKKRDKYAERANIFTSSVWRNSAR